jgi:hypothetical protein
MDSEKSQYVNQNLLVNVASKHVSIQLEGSGSVDPVPRFSLSFVDIDLLRSKVTEWSAKMKEFFNNHGKGYIFLNHDGNNGSVRRFKFPALSSNYNFTKFGKYL